MDSSDVASDRRLPRDYEHTGFRLSWGAIVAGLVIALMLQVVLSLLGLAIGLSTWSPGEGIPALNTTAGVWASLSALISLGIGGIATGRLAGVVTKGDGALHGVVLWGLTMLLGFWLVINGAGFLLGNVFNALGETISVVAESTVQGVVEVGTAAGGATGDLDFGALQREVEEILRETGDPALAPDTLGQLGDTAAEQVTGGTASLTEIAGSVVDRIEARAGEVDREDIINVVVARTDLSRQEAERVADRVESTTSTLRQQVSAEVDTLGRQAEQELRQGASTAADWGATGAWWTLLIMLLGAGAAAGGAAVTARS